jgi:hypothetical protein
MDAAEIQLRDIGREGFIKLIEEHKRRCIGHCNISLITIRLWLEEVGINFTDEEKKVFI